MKIAYVLETFPAISETFVLNEIVELVNRGHDVEIISINRPDAHLLRAGAKLGIRTSYLEEISTMHAALACIKHFVVHPIRTSKFFRQVRRLPAQYSWLARRTCFIAAKLRIHPDVVHAHFIGPGARIALLLGVLLDRPFTVTAHRYDIFDRPLPDLPLLVASAKRCVTVSAFNRDYLVNKFGVPAAHIAVVPCGVNTRVFTPETGPYGTESKRVRGRILSIGRLAPEKGMDILIEAAERLMRSGVDFSLRIIGDGALKDTLTNQIKEKGLNGKVELLGAQSSEVVLQELRLSEVFALASTSESLGVVYLEAMATETPVVGSDVLGVPEVIRDGETGYLVPPNSVDQMAGRIKALLQNPAHGRKMGQRGREWVTKRFTLASQVDGVLSVWLGAAERADREAALDERTAEKANSENRR